MSRNPIRIGIGAPLSGPGAMANAVTLAVDEANALAMKSAPPIEVVVGDDQGQETNGAAVARSLAEDPRVLAVIGHYNSNVSLPVMPIYAEAGLAVVSPIVSNPALTEAGPSNVFRFTNRDAKTAAAIVDYIVHKFGKRRAVAVRSATVYGRSMCKEFVRAFLKAGGTMLAEHTVAEGPRDFGALAASLPGETELVFYGGTYEGAPLLRELRAAGQPQLFAAGDGCWDIENFLKPAAGAAEVAEGVLVLSACPEVGVVAGSREFSERFAHRFGPIRNYAVNAYDAAGLVIAAIRSTSSTRHDRASVLAAVHGACHRGIAYPEPTRWNDRHDNAASITALHVVQNHDFHQVALIPHD